MEETENLSELGGTRTAALQEVQTIFSESSPEKKMDRASKTSEYNRRPDICIIEMLQGKKGRSLQGSRINDG